MGVGGGNRCARVRWPGLLARIIVAAAVARNRRAGVPGTTGPSQSGRLPGNGRRTLETGSASTRWSSLGPALKDAGVAADAGEVSADGGTHLRCGLGRRKQFPGPYRDQGVSGPLGGVPGLLGGVADLRPWAGISSASAWRCRASWKMAAMRFVLAVITSFYSPPASPPAGMAILCRFQGVMALVGIPQAQTRLICPAWGRHVGSGRLSGAPDPPPGALPLRRQGFLPGLQVLAERLLFPETAVHPGPARPRSHRERRRPGSSCRRGRAPRWPARRPAAARSPDGPRWRFRR